MWEQNHNIFLFTIHKVLANFLKIAIEFLLETLPLACICTWVAGYVSSDISEEHFIALLNNFALAIFYSTIFN